MPEVRALLISLTGNTELAASGEFVFASNPRKSRDTLITVSYTHLTLPTKA